MKTIALIAALIMIPLFAHSIITPDVLSFVSEKVTYPENAKIEKAEGMVLVQFSVNNNGQLQILQMNSSNPLLAEYVREKLAEIVVPTNMIQPQIYSMKFNFRLL